MARPSRRPRRPASPSRSWRSTTSTASRPPLGGIAIADPTDKTKQIAVPAGGAEHMATLVRELRAKKKHSVFVAAGDLIGASPLLSAAFHDEPTIEALSAMGLEITAVGNHEFDEGKTELLRMQNGGCHPDGRLQGPAQVRGRQVPLPRSQHHRQADRQDVAAGLRGQGVRRHPRGLHRPDPEGHAQDRDRPRASRASSSATRPRPSTRWCPSSSSVASRPSSC